MASDVPHIGESAELTGYTIPPRLTTEVTLRVDPNAVCILRAEGDPDPNRSFTLYADHEGVVTLHVRPNGEHDGTAKLTLDCEVEGKRTRYPLQLRPHHEPTSDTPAPPSRLPKPRRHGATTRPALTMEKALRLSDEELREGGYPLRPDPDQAPWAFNTWRRAVSTEAVGVEARVVPRPGVRHDLANVAAGPASSNNWSGFELSGAAGTYDWVTGMWRVPSVTSESNTYTYSALWIGLDGDGTTDLVQAGTEQEVLDIDFSIFGFPIHFAFTNYYLWTEFLPQEPTEQQVTNFPVHPGDEIFAEVYVANAGGSPSLGGFFGQFLLENLTTSEYTWHYTPVGATVVGGSEAVWIMERPTVGGNLPDLADFGSATMFNAYARKANSPRHQGYVPYQGAANKQITMVNGADTLSTVTAIDTYSMRFDWQNFH